MQDQVESGETFRVENENERISQENARQAAEVEREHAVGDQVKQAEAWAKGTRDGVPVPSSDETYENNAEYYAINSYDSSVISGSFMRIAGKHAEDSEAYAIGKRNGVDVPSTDETYHNNSKYYRDQAANIMAELDGTVRAKGTCMFADLPEIAATRPGDMWNIIDEFVTTSDFREGAGKTIGAGANVYMTVDSKWDVFAGSTVTGIKGDAEAEYRTGNINITHANLGMETKPVANSVNPVESDGIYKVMSEIAPIENNSVSIRNYGVGDEFVYLNKLCKATNVIAIGDTFTEHVGTLSLTGDIESITKIKIDGAEYTSFDNLPVCQNSVVTLYHASERGWEYYDVERSGLIILGDGEACNFIVPSDATGHAELFIEDGHTLAGLDNLYLRVSSGWVTSVVPSLGESAYPDQTANYIAVDNLAKQVGQLNTNITATYNSKDIPFRFGIDANGRYGYYKDGADTVTPFKTVVNLGSGTSFNLTGYAGYQSFTEDNFYIVCTGYHGSKGRGGADSAQFNSSGMPSAIYNVECWDDAQSINRSLSKSYNQSTGILTIGNSSGSANYGITVRLRSNVYIHTSATGTSSISASIDYYVLLIY